MKRLLPIALLLVLAVVVLAVWLGNDRGADPEPEGVAAEEVVEAAADVEDGEPRLSADSSAPGEQRSGAAEESAAAQAAEEAPRRAALTVTGRVRMPASCGSVQDVEVFLLSERTEVNGLLNLFNEEERESFEARFPGAFDGRSLGYDPDEDDEEEEDEDRLRLLARSTVDAEGRFTLDVPAGDELRGHLLATGPSTYTWRTRRVHLRPGAQIDVFPECGARVRGRVLPPEGVAGSDVAGTRVVLASSREGFTGMPTGNRETRRHATVGADGAFQFDALPTDGDYLLEVYSERFASTKVNLPVPAPGEEVVRDVRLEAGGTVRGKVVDAEGGPLAGARVEAQLPGQMFGFDNRIVRLGETDAEGRFELTGLASGALVLRAELEGWRDSKDARVQLTDQGLSDEVVLELDRGNVVSGRVTWSDGQPAANLEVRVHFDVAHMMGMDAMGALRGASAETTSDADGRFELGGLGKGPFSVVAESEPPARLVEGSVFDEHRSAAADQEGGPEELVAPETWLWRARLDGVPPTARDLELVLSAPAGVAGRVEDHEGNPVQEFEVQLARQADTMLGTMAVDRDRLAFENPGGTFFVPGLFEGTYKLFVTAEGFATPEPLELKLPFGDEHEPLVLRLEPSATLSGVVRSPFGSPVIDAEVTAGGSQPAWMAAFGGTPDVPTTHTDGEGRFVLEDLRAGEVTLSATSREFARSLPQVIEVGAGETVEGLEIVMREGGRISGEVYASDGSPAAGMRVQLTQMETFDGRSVACDSEGRFLAKNLDPGTWQVSAMPAGLSDALNDDAEGGLGEWLKDMRNTMTDVADGEETHVVLGRPPANPIRVYGRVTHDGVGYEGALVGFFAEGSKSLERNRIASVDAAGRYETTLDSGGNYVVTVQKITGSPGEQNTIEYTIEIPQTEQFEQDFEVPTGRISGRVLGPDGKPATNARVSLRPEGGTSNYSLFGSQFVEWKTDAEGRFDLQGLRPGTYRLTVGGQGVSGMLGGTTKFARAVRADMRLGEGEWMRDVDFELEEAGKIEVEVVDQDGKPVGGAAVFVRDSGGNLVDRFSWISTDTSGKCVFTGLGEGTYSVNARDAGRTAAEAPEAFVTPDKVEKVRVELSPGGGLLLLAADDAGNPERATFSVRDSSGREWSGMLSLTDLAGLLGEGGLSLTEHRVGPLPPGRYRVTATTEDGRSARRTVTVRPGDQRTVSFKLDE